MYDVILPELPSLNYICPDWYALKPVSLEIQTDSIKLVQKDLEITIDIRSDTLEQIEVLAINGFRFVKEKQNEQK